MRIVFKYKYILILSTLIFVSFFVLFHLYYRKTMDKPKQNFTTNVQEIKVKDTTTKKSEDTTTKKLDEKIDQIDYTKDKLLCMVLLSKSSLESLGVPLMKSWGHRCNKTVIICNCKEAKFTKKENEEYIKKWEILELPIVEDYNKMAEKVMVCMKVIYEKYGQEFNWFLMTDHDTFIFTRNLFKFIRTKNTSLPLTYGYNLVQEVPTGYQQGGAGILFTHEATKRIYNRIKEGGCNYVNGYGDIALGHCYNEVGVKMGNSLDSKGRERFHPFEPKWHYFNTFPNWVFSYSQNGVKSGDECCSDETISFHYVNAEQMLTLAFFNKFY